MKKKTVALTTMGNGKVMAVQDNGDTWIYDETYNEWFRKSSLPGMNGRTEFSHLVDLLEKLNVKVRQ